MNPIQISNLSKSYILPWKKGRVEAVKGLNFEVKSGEIFGLLGPNGSGKSTTLKLILGLVEPSKGKIEVFGDSIQNLVTRKRIGFLPESPNFYHFLTGEELLRFYGRLCEVPRKQLTRKIDELINLVGLEKGRKRALSTYSKGMLQRIGLAQALVHDPELLLLDEPTAGVDPIGAREIKDLILELKARGKTIVLCSHWLDQVEEVCDRVAILHEGKKALEGKLSDLLTARGETQLIVKGFRKEQEEEVKKTLEQLNLEWVEARKSKKTLETLFMEKVTQ